MAIEAGDAAMRWDVGRSRWRRRPGIDATVVATNGAAMLVRVVLRPDLDIGAHVHVALAEGTGTAAIRHIAPTGDTDGIALVGIELVTTDEALAAHLAQRADGLDSEGRTIDRWWWQLGS